MKNNLILSFDVESIGLHGEAYAVGYVVTGAIGHGDEIASGRFACPPIVAKGDAASREWVSENIAPIEVTHGTPGEVAAAFAVVLTKWTSEGAIVVAECAWPVEARFLLDVVRHTPGNAGPYPLHDVATALLAAGMDPLATYARFDNEQPKHDPLADARQSARLWCGAMRRVERAA